MKIYFLFLLITIFILPTVIAQTYNETECVQDRLSTDGICINTPLEAPVLDLANGIGYLMNDITIFFYNFTPGYFVYLIMMTVAYAIIYLMWWIRVSFNDMP